MTVANLLVIGLIAGAIGGQLKSIQTWGDAVKPSFIGSVLLQVAAVVTALVK